MKKILNEGKPWFPKPGDRVKIHEPDHDLHGKTGTIHSIDGDEHHVKLDEPQVDKMHGGKNTCYSTVAPGRRLRRLNETASAGSTGAGSIAVVQSRLGDMRKRESLKSFLTRFYKKLDNRMHLHTIAPQFGTIKEAYDLSDVVSQLKGLENSDVKHENTVTYGVEDDNGNIMKISVKKDQAKDFEYRLATEMDQAKNDNLSGKTGKTSLAELLYNLKDEFNIVDVEFPKIPKDVIYNADKATKAPAGNAGAQMGENDDVDDMNPDQGMEGDQDLEGGEGGEGFDENGEPLTAGGQGGEGLEGGEEGKMGEEDLEAPEGDDESVEDFGEENAGSSPESILNAVMQMLKSQADAEKAKADAAAEESRARQAEYAYKTAQSTVAHEEEFAQMEVEADQQKQKEKDAKRLADLAKAKVQKASSFREGTSILGQVIQEMTLNELDDGMDTEQSVNRAKNDLRMKYRPMPGDMPETIAYKKQALQAGMLELDDKLKGIRIRNQYLMKQKQLQAKLQAQQAQPQNGNQPQTDVAPNQSMNGM